MADEAHRMVPVPTEGRVFAASRRVQTEEVTPSRRLRLDALARYLTSVAMEDVYDAGLNGSAAWVVRRTEIRLSRPPALGEVVELQTFCSGAGSRWAERRTSLRGQRGGGAEAVSIWVCLDPKRGRPMVLSEEFRDCYGPSARGRRVTARLRHPDLPAAAPPGRPFSLRSADVDAYGHLNNSVAWEMVEEELARHWDGGWPGRAELEYHSPITPCPAVDVVAMEGTRTLDLWVRAGGETRATARLWRAPAAVALP